MAAAAVKAGLLPAGAVEALLEMRTHEAKTAYLSKLDEVERVRAEEFLQQAREAAERQWSNTLDGSGDAAVTAPRADVAYTG
eukprot:10345271-Karenia_brevis.AAC.1